MAAAHLLVARRQVLLPQIQVGLAQDVERVVRVEAGVDAKAQLLQLGAEPRVQGEGRGGGGGEQHGGGQSGGTPGQRALRHSTHHSAQANTHTHATNNAPCVASCMSNKL